MEHKSEQLILNTSGNDSIAPLKDRKNSMFWSEKYEFGNFNTTNVEKPG